MDAPSGLDKLDIRILRELFQGQQQAASLIRPDIKLTLRAIGKRVAVPEGTIRDRLDKMYKTGFLKGFVLRPNPSLRGLRVGALAFDVPASTSKSDLIERLRLMEGVLVIVNAVGTFVYLLFFYEDETSRQRKIDLISKVAGTRSPAFTRVLYPRCDIRLSKTDWRIMRTLEENVSKSYRAIAEKSHMSSRTVKRRLARMAGEGRYTPSLL